MNGPDAWSIFKEKIFWFLLLLGCLYFLPPLLFGKTFFFRDLGYDFVPQKYLFSTLIRNGNFPLWDEFRHGGQPYLGDLNNSALYPANILYALLPFFKAFPLTLLFHTLCALASSYVLARSLGFVPSASVVTAILYGFCGYTLSLINLHGRFLAVAIFPLLLWFWHQSFLKPAKRRWFLLAVFTGAAQVFAGAPEVNVISLLTMLGWALAYPYPECSVVYKGRHWIVLGVCIIGVSLIQLLPTAEMGLLSMRGEGIGYEIFSQWSLYPGRLLELVIPNFFGYADRLPYSEYYWGGELGESGYPYILSIYVGAVALALAIIGGLHPVRCFVLPRRLRRLLLCVCGIALLLSFGRYLPGFRFLSQLPLITIFRYPIKFLLAGIFPVALLSGYATHLYFVPRESFSIGKSMLGIFWGVAFFFTGCGSVFFFSKSLSESAQQYVFHKLLGEVALKSLSMSWLHLTVIWLVMSLLFTYHFVKPNLWQQWLLTALIAVDLLSSGARVNFYAPQEFFTKMPPIVPIIQRQLGDGRFFRTAHSLPEQLFVEPQDVLDAPPDHVLWVYRWKFEVLSKYLASYYQIPVIFHEDYDLLAQRYVMKLGKTLKQVPWPQKLPLLSAGNVTLFVTSDKLAVPGVERIKEISNRGEMPFFLYKNLDTANRVEFVSEWKIVNSDDDALHWMLAPGYDPRRRVVIQRPKVHSIPEETGAICQKPAETAMTVLKKTAVTQQLVVSHACAGFLVFAEPFFPGWHVRVDGESTQIFRANLAFSAVFLPPGTHRIERVYRPKSFVAGLIGSLAFCAVCGAWGIVQRPRRKRRTQNAVR